MYIGLVSSHKNCYIGEIKVGFFWKKTKINGKFKLIKKNVCLDLNNKIIYESENYKAHKRTLEVLSTNQAGIHIDVR